MRDAVELEWAGVPSVCIVHKELHDSARAIARISGCPDYEFILVDYPYIPIAAWSDEECVAVAQQVAPAVIRLLTTQRNALRRAEEPAPAG